jgi:hypothetical protein
MSNLFKIGPSLHNAFNGQTDKVTQSSKTMNFMQKKWKSLNGKPNHLTTLCTETLGKKQELTEAHPSRKVTSIFSILKKCLSLGGEQTIQSTPAAQRRLSLDLAKIHQQLTELGIPTYHAWITAKYPSAPQDACGGQVNHFKLIKYLAPENIANINHDGSIARYSPRPSEDIWALGIIFFSLLWDGQEPEFLELHWTLRDLANAEPFSPSAFEAVKQRLPKAYQTFHKNHKKDAAEYPLKRVVLQMLDPDPTQRISPAECCTTLESYLETRREKD